MKHEVYLSLGTNLGDKDNNLRHALQMLDTRVGHVERVSHFISTEPWGFQSAHEFRNACCRCSTTLTPRQVMNVTQQIERDMGRREKSHDGHYKDRLIDIDILLYDHLHIDEPDLKIPHPFMHERDFVMRPLQEILTDTKSEL